MELNKCSYTNVIGSDKWHQNFKEINHAPEVSSLISIITLLMSPLDIFSLTLYFRQPLCVNIFTLTLYFRRPLYVNIFTLTLYFRRPLCVPGVTPGPPPAARCSAPAPPGTVRWTSELPTEFRENFARFRWHLYPVTNMTISRHYLLSPRPPPPPSPPTKPSPANVVR